MERYQPDQYGRMMLDAHGQWVSLRAAEITALDAAQKSSADAQATVEALQAVIKQMGEQACVLAKDGMAAKAQVAALQRERDHAKNMAAVQKEVADNQTWHVRELTAALDAEREKVQALRDERDRLLLRVKDLERQVERLEDAALHADENF